jgi:hypothetical protein
MILNEIHYSPLSSPIAANVRSHVRRPVVLFGRGAPERSEVLLGRRGRCGADRRGAEEEHREAREDADDAHRQPEDEAGHDPYHCGRLARPARRDRSDEHGPPRSPR